MITLSRKLGNLDGIRPYDEEHFIVSDWRAGKVFLVQKETGSDTEILEAGQSLDDIAYLKDKGMLLLPTNRQKKKATHI